jgi:hypothetical protein
VTRGLRNLLLPATLLVLLALPSSALASPEQVVRDCAQDGTLDRSYSNADLRKARDELPSDLDEYSDCREVIGAAIKGGSDRGGGRGSGGAGGAGSPEEMAARTKDQAKLDANAASRGETRPKLEVGGRTVEPGPNGLFDLSSAENGMPTPLLVALIAIGVLALVGCLVALRERIPLLARIPLLSKIPTPRVTLPRLRR